MNAVTKWFGKDFEKLDPLLQKLHRDGGELRGYVALGYGKGLGGLIGRWLAPKLGIPLISGDLEFKVTIDHSEDRLYWNRVFCNQLKMSSEFIPYGQYPDGYWKENTGSLEFELGVEIVNGGWHWVQRRFAVG